MDTEEASVQEVPIGDESGQLIIKDNRTMLFWYSNTTSFIIKGSISEQEIVKMAESLEKKLLNKCHKSPPFIVVYSEER